MKDWCTGFPEYWYSWYKFKKVYIGDCCKRHDEQCSTKPFINCLKRKKVIGSWIIALVAATACLIRYGKV